MPLHPRQHLSQGKDWARTPCLAEFERLCCPRIFSTALRPNAALNFTLSASLKIFRCPSPSTTTPWSPSPALAVASVLTKVQRAFSKASASLASTPTFAAIVVAASRLCSLATVPPGATARISSRLCRRSNLAEKSTLSDGIAQARFTNPVWPCSRYCGPTRSFVDSALCVDTPVTEARILPFNIG